MGSARLPVLNKIDVRVGKLFHLSENRSLEASVDFDNLTNADTVWSVRNRTEATTFTYPTTGTRATLQQFMSPVAIGAADRGVPRRVQVLDGALGSYGG